MICSVQMYTYHTSYTRTYTTSFDSCVESWNKSKYVIESNNQFFFVRSTFRTIRSTAYTLLCYIYKRLYEVFTSCSSLITFNVRSASLRVFIVCLYKSGVMRHNEIWATRTHRRQRRWWRWRCGIQTPPMPSNIIEHHHHHHHFNAIIIDVISNNMK